ncbi:hypothetical protein DFH09DRAFT_1367191 [Mycena vulgaris]|nr:hypothetical protein DFH09DRAFT_1367191 [Mycena vulgaris]
MTIPFIPPELIDAIVEEVDNIKSLKACSLVASNFRVMSQRILLCSVTLDDSYRWQYPALCTLLTESPHVAEYITGFTLRPSSEYQFGDSQRLLAKLTNVRRFTIRGGYGYMWSQLGPVAEGILAFIQRQELAELQVTHVRDIPLAVLARLVSSAPVLSFTEVTSLFFPGVPVAPDLPVGVPIRELVLSNCRRMCTTLASPEFAFCMTDLRKVGFSPHSDEDHEILSVAARTLEHVRFQRLCVLKPVNDTPIPPLPRLVALRSLALAIHAVHHMHWLIASITSISASHLPALQEIYVTYSANDRAFQPPYFPVETMVALDGVLAAFPDSPYIRWRIEFEWADEGQHATNFANFVRFVELRLPAVRAAGRLTVEPYWFGGDRGEWASR